MRQVYKDPTNADNEIYKLSFFSPSTGYVGFRDWIGFTTDSGRTFTKKFITMGNVDFNGHNVNLTFGFGINGVKAFSQDTLLAYGDYGLVPAILYSVNGGNTFKLIYHSQFDPMQLRTGITDMIFPQNGSIGYAVDADRILKTTNRGVSWSVVRTDPGSYFEYLEAVDNNTLFAFSTHFNTSKLLKTSNAGLSWQPVTLPTDQKVSYAYFLTALKGWLNTWNTNDGGHTYYTSNGGSTWTRKNLPDIAPFRTNKMRFLNDSTGFALSGLFQVYKTTDSGKIWQRLPRNTQFEYLGYSHNDLQVWSNTQLWAGGGHGFLELSINGGGTPIPAALFLIDTVGHLQTNTVNLVNYSKPGYQYEWWVNNTLVSTAYHASYTRNIYSLQDSIKLVVTNGTTSDTLMKYQYFHPPVIVESFTPTTGGVGTVITITGKKFTGATNVTFGGSAASFTVQNDSTIRATVGSGATGSVRVTTPTGFGSLPGFTFIPPPVISSFTPTSAVAGTTVTLNGQNFNNVTAVSFGGVAASSFTVLSPTTISAVVGVGATGSVSVTAIGGTATVPGFVALPNITSFTPTAGTFGTHMTITGTGFTGTTSVSVGGTPVASFTVHSHTSISAVLSGGASGNVTLTTPGGSSTLAAFNYYEPPTITTFTPLNSAVGSTVTITGSNFDPVAANNVVYFGGVKAVVLAASATSLSVLVPPSATYAPISVTTNQLTAYSRQPFIASFANGGAITAQSFDSIPLLNLGPNEYLEHTAIGDLDGDGKPEIVAIKRGYYVSDAAVAVYRNTSTSTAVSFAPKIELPMLNSGGGVALADLDGDGKLDIAATEDDENRICLYRNLSTAGTLSFASRFDVLSTRMNRNIAIQDLDGDGKPDLAFSTWWEGKLVVHRNISNPGSFAFGPRIDISGPAERNIQIRDMDGDGKPELMDAGRIFKNTSTRGSISFAAPISYPGYTHSYVAVGDIDGDGKADIVTSDPYGSKAAVYRNTSTTTISLAPVVLVDMVASPGMIALSDIDGDGKVDIASPLSNFRVGISKNTSTPGTISFAPKIGYFPGYNGVDKRISAGDLNGDGKPEIVVAPFLMQNNVKPEPFIESFTPTIGQSGTSVSITGANFTGTTAVSFGGVPATSFVVNSPTSITAVVGSGSSGDVAVQNAVGTGNRPGFVFGFPPEITNFSPQAGPEGSTVTITGNRFGTAVSDNQVYFGSVKATVTSATATSLTVTVPKGATYFPITVTTNKLTAYSDKPFLTTFPGSTGFTASSFGDTARFSTTGGIGNVIDVDGDGKLDIVSIAVNNTIRISLNTSTATAVSFAPFVSLNAGTSPSNVGFGDIDGDGKQDIVVAHGSAMFVSVFLNNSTPGNVVFGARRDFSTGLDESGYGPIVRDLDRDGKPEIIVSSYDRRSVSVYPNTSTAGNASFALRIDYALNGYATDIKVDDIDGDQLPDLVAPVNGPEEVSIFRNTSVPGSISFALKTDIALGSWPQSTTIGDLDGDGRKEVLVANLNGASVSILKNNSSPGAINMTRTDLSVSFRPWTVWINDMDGDGKPDLGVQKEANNNFNSNERSIAIYKNNSTPGNLLLATPFEYPVGDYTVRSVTGDMTGDGKPDMIVFNSQFNPGSGGWISTLLILKNKFGQATTVNVCPNGNAALVSNVSGASYQWQQNSGTGFVNVSNTQIMQGTSKDTLQLVGIPASWNGYQFRCVAGADTSVVFVLSMNPVPVANAGRDTAICLSSSVTIGSTALPGHTYAWSPSNTLNTGTTATPVATPTATTSYVLTVTNNFGCSAKDTVTITTMQVPTPTVTAGGPVSFCSGNTVVLTSSGSSGNQWYRNGLVITGATAQTYTAFQTGSYTVRVTANGCTSQPSQGIGVSATSAPAPPIITATGSTSVCQGSAVLLNSSDTGSHQWYKDGVLIAGVTQAFYSAFESGTYTAVKVRSGCASVASNGIAVTITNTMGTPSVTVTGSSTICQGDSVVLTSSAVQGNQWFRDGNMLPGATLQTYSAKQSGVYSVRVTSNSCTSNMSSGMAITVNQIPSTPAITKNGNTLTSSATSGNQWFKDSVVISGATGQSYTTTANGLYTVKVTLNGCTSIPSSPVNVNLSGGRVAMGPNPVTNRLTLSYPTNNDPLQAIVTDMNGHRVFASQPFTTSLDITMAGLRAGTYIVEVTNQKTGEKERQVILKF